VVHALASRQPTIAGILGIVILERESVERPDLPPIVGYNVRL
jgi:hypothetical protein